MFLASSFLTGCWEFILRHPGLLLVLVGVAGEVICDWKDMSGRLARAKKISAILLVIGLAVEFIEAAKSDKELAETKERTAVAVREASQANERAAKFDADRVVIQKQAEEIRSTNFVLQTKLLELEARFRERTITESDGEKFIKLLANVPKGNVVVYINGNSGSEVQNYAEQIRQMIGAAGYDVGKMCAQGWGGGQIPKGISVAVKSATNQPPFAGQIQNALKTIGIETTGYLDDSLDEKTMKIFVGSKP